jgi:hypothetical protein
MHECVPEAFLMYPVNGLATAAQNDPSRLTIARTTCEPLMAALGDRFGFRIVNR